MSDPAVDVSSGFVGGNAHWLIIVSDDKLDELTICLFAENDSYGRVLMWLLYFGIKNRQISHQLAQIGCFKLACL